jgi:hypothetical protein
MPASLPTKRHVAPSRLRGVISTILLIMLVVMIVRDVLARRWGFVPPTPPNVTHRSS